MHGRHLPMPDYHDIFNALSPSPTSRPGHVNFDVHWSAAGRRQRVRDTAFQFVGKFVPSAATISFRVRDDSSSVVYSSNPGGQTTVSGGVGHERNGVFFS